MSPETRDHEQLLVAPGDRPRRLALLERFTNVHTLRTPEDANALRGVIAEGDRLVIIGAGFIGHEVAAAASRAGVHTTIVEAGIPGATVIAATGTHRVTHLTLSDRRHLACDHVLVGVGVEPELD
ncbi:MAG TPA: FAD-dependent oxidoreductase [Solirubrobacteraceae bacterium]